MEYGYNDEYKEFALKNIEDTYDLESVSSIESKEWSDDEYVSGEDDPDFSFDDDNEEDNSEEEEYIDNETEHDANGKC